MIFRLVQELADDESFLEDRGVDIAVACRILKVSTSGFYEWRKAQVSPSKRHVADVALTETITLIHEGSRGNYGAPRVHAELRLGLDVTCSRKRVARLMREADA